MNTIFTEAERLIPSLIPAAEQLGDLVGVGRDHSMAGTATIVASWGEGDDEEDDYAGIYDDEEDDEDEDDEEDDDEDEEGLYLIYLNW